MTRNPSTYWFPAKRYGWGWGLPIAWQGWLVLGVFTTLLAAGAFVFPPQNNLTPFLLYTLVLTVALVGICYAKGEPPAWHWAKS